ncbi:hypothetical protein KR018_002486 [Drosophila ironensis]|nr:hypothetical protein KR018_002486 [Drosophila ironensis]
MKTSGLEAKVVLVDIEGTTTSISFVHDVLFPYARQHVGHFLKQSWDSEETVSIVEDLQKEPTFADYMASLSDSSEEVDAELIAGFVRFLIKKDLKVTPMKTLQGLIWARGYASGDLKGHVYEDVPPAFQAWRDAGLRIAVYSSGSVAAQKLIFGHSIAGNLLAHLSAHFDTHVGHKQQQQSYANIAATLGEAPQHILFLTDVPNEASAAHSAGLQAILLQRPGNAPLTEEETTSYDVIPNFKALHALQLPKCK